MNKLQVIELILRIAGRVLESKVDVSEEDLQRLTLADFLLDETFDQVIERKRRQLGDAP